MSQGNDKIGMNVNGYVDQAAPAEQMVGAGRSLWGDAWRRLWRDRSAKLCLAIILLYALVALATAAYELAAESMPDLHWRTYKQMADYDNRAQAPSVYWSNLWKDPGKLLSNWQNMLGTDWSGKSVLIKTLYGAKVSITVGLMANIIAVPLGLILGALAGYYGRWVDNIVVWLYSTLASVPSIILLISIKYAFQDPILVSSWFPEGIDLSGIHGLYLALGVISWISTCRYIRAETMKLREMDYVMAARATGRSSLSIIRCHILPNVFHIAIINFSLGFIGAVSAEVILSYLGLGVAVGTPSWGQMINSARMDLFAGRWWELTSAVTAIFFLVLALNIFGDRLRDALDPKLKNV